MRRTDFDGGFAILIRGSAAAAAAATAASLLAAHAEATGAAIGAQYGAHRPRELWRRGW